MLRRRSPSECRQFVVGEFEEQLWRWLQSAGRSCNTVSAYCRGVWELGEWLRLEAKAGPGLSDLRPAHLQDYQAHLGARGLSAASICRKLDAISGFFRYLARAEIIDRNPLDAMPRARPKNGRLVWMPEDEGRRVLEVGHGTTERAVFLTLYRTGRRKGEPMALRLGDIDLGQCVLTIEAQKARSVRHVPIAGWLRASLRECMAQRPDCPCERFFVTPCQHVALHSGLLQRWFRRSMHDAGLADGGYCEHTLRHLAATNWLRNGLYVTEAQHLMGHTGPETTSRYLHYSPTEMREKMERMSPDQPPVSDACPVPGCPAAASAAGRLAVKLSEAAEQGDVAMVTALTGAREALRSMAA